MRHLVVHRVLHLVPDEGYLFSLEVVNSLVEYFLETTVIVLSLLQRARSQQFFEIVNVELAFRGARAQIKVTMFVPRKD